MKTDICISMCSKLLLSVNLERVGLEGFVEYVKAFHTPYLTISARITDNTTIQCAGRNIFREGTSHYLRLYGIVTNLFWEKNPPKSMSRIQVSRIRAVFEGVRQERQPTIENHINSNHSPNRDRR